MFTIDRINLLRDYYGLSPLLPKRLTERGTLTGNNFKLTNPYPCHAFLDVLDTKAGINTRGYKVGERIRTHQLHIGRLDFARTGIRPELKGGSIMRGRQLVQTSPPNYYHWLGAAGVL